MDRGYTQAEYLAMVKDFRKTVKGGRISTDIIVGFPGESDSDFEQTRDIIEKVGFNCAFIFKYSLRPNSPAQNLKDDVPKVVKEKRHKILLDLQKKISHA